MTIEQFKKAQQIVGRIEELDRFITTSDTAINPQSFVKIFTKPHDDTGYACYVTPDDSLKRKLLENIRAQKEDLQQELEKL